MWFSQRRTQFVKSYARVRALVMACMLSILMPHPGAATSAGVALPSLAPVIKATSPAVVNIATRGTLTERVVGNPLREDPYFRRFFNVPEGGAVRRRQFQSAGSGVIISALGRTGIHPHGYEDFIQTDASINPGNSGGALVNLNGELIGINSAFLSKDGGNIGIGFAIPVNMVKAVMDQLITYGEVKRGIVGIKLRDVTPEAAESLQLVNARGVEISEVAPGSAADHAGIKVGDVAVSMNCVSLESAAQLRNGLALLRVGQSVDMRLLRNGAERSVTLTINPPSSLNRP